MSRLTEFADETCLSQGDLLRVTEDMIDAKTGIIRLNHGRSKTGVEQVPPLTSRCRQIVAEIETNLKQSNVRNVHGLVFTNPNSSPITKGQIQYQTEKAVKNAGIRKFVFHNYQQHRSNTMGPPRHQCRRGDEQAATDQCRCIGVTSILKRQISPPPSAPRKLLRELLQMSG